MHPDARWELSADGTLTISGTGSVIGFMPNERNPHDAVVLNLTTK